LPATRDGLSAKERLAASLAGMLSRSATSGPSGRSRSELLLERELELLLKLSGRLTPVELSALSALFALSGRARLARGVSQGPEAVVGAAGLAGGFGSAGLRSCESTCAAGRTSLTKLFIGGSRMALWSLI